MDCIIIDIDGTISDCEHRRHHVTGETKDWKSFFNHDLVMQDRLIEPVAKLINILCEHYTPVYVTGRSERDREITEKWLAKHDMPRASLWMRKLEDHRDDFVVKREILNLCIRANGLNPIFAIDDRNSVVAMWREEGITCLQVAEGNF